MNVPDDMRCRLDNLHAAYGEEFLDTDPLGLVHRYTTAEDRETAGMFAACLAYGAAGQIRNSAANALGRLGPSPAETAADIDPDGARLLFGDFRHRWTSGDDAAFLVWVVGEAIREYGSLGGLVRRLDRAGDPTIERTIAALAGWIADRYPRFSPGNRPSRNISYLFPSPAGGSACKRPALFFRWMVRGPDGVDFGHWDWIDPGRLIVPVDRHMARMGRRLGFTARKNADWRMACDITAALKCLDPHDPLKYDFALVRPGILRHCAQSGGMHCSGCMLQPLCGAEE